MKRVTATPHKDVQLAVSRVCRRDLKKTDEILLFVRAGGQCEFHGCAKDVCEHGVTKTPGLFSQKAHIVAFSSQGPRAQDGPRPSDIHALDNLMLLCPDCHKLVDDYPVDYPRATLEAYKHEHERRIRAATAIGPDTRTHVAVFKAPIRGKIVDVAPADIIKAIKPRHQSSSQWDVIDLNGFAGPRENAAFLDAAVMTMRSRIARLFDRGGPLDACPHMSLFALGPIPLLVALGAALDDKIPLDLYQRHRDTQDWCWKTDGPNVAYRFSTVQERGREAPVALVLSLSGLISMCDLPEATRENATIYEISLEDRTPDPTFLRRRDDLVDFGLAYRAALARIAEIHGALDAIDLFPAAPAPIAVMCGRERLPKVHPALRVYDFEKDAGGFCLQLMVN